MRKGPNRRVRLLPVTNVTTESRSVFRGCDSFHGSHDSCHVICLDVVRRICDNA